MLNRTAHVVGRGIIGLSLAYELGKRGWRVFVVGPRAKPGTASRAAVGASSMKGKIHASKPLFAVKMYGHEGMPSWIREVEARSGRKIRYDFDGLFEPFSTAKEFDWIRERVFHKEFSGCLNVELIPQTEFVAKGLPLHLTRPSWKGAFRFPKDGWVHPEDLLDALEAAHLNAGGIFLEQEVERVSPTGGPELAVETAAGTLTAKTVIVAAGIFSNEILRASGFETAVQRGLPGETLVGADTGPEANLALRVGKLNYVRSGTEVRIGSTPFDGISGDLEAVSAEAFGPLKNSVRKAGIRGRFRDRMPALGQILFPGRDVGPWVSLGYHKNGYQLAHLFAQKLVSLLDGAPAAPDVEPFLVNRLTP